MCAIILLMVSKVKKFHIVSDFFLRRMEINQNEKIYTFNIIENNFFDEDVKFYLDFDDIKEITPNSKEAKNLFIILNIIEEEIEKSGIETYISDITKEIRKELKKNNSKLLEKDYIDIEKIQILTERMENVESNPEFYLNNLSLFITFALTHINCLRKTIKQKALKEGVDWRTQLFTLIDSINSFLDNEKEKTEWLTDMGNPRNNKCILIRNDQPMCKTPILRVPPELVKMEYLKYTPYGYQVIQLNSKYSIIVIDDWLETDNIFKLNEDELNELSNYLYKNAFIKLNHNLYSNSKSKILDFYSELEYFDTGDSIFETEEEYSNYFVDEKFTTGPGYRDNEYYIPNFKLIERLKFENNRVLTEQCKMLWELRTPLQSFTYKVQSDLKKNLRKYFDKEINRNELIKILNMDMEILVKLLRNLTGEKEKLPHELLYDYKELIYERVMNKS